MLPIDLAQGIIWGHRLLLGRDPADQPTVDTMVELVSSPEDIRRLLLGSIEYSAKFDNVGRADPTLHFPLDLREGVIWGYRLIFQQEPSEQQIEIQLPRVTDVGSLRGIFVLSREFELREGFGAPELLDYEVLRRFAPFHATPAAGGFFADFLGGVTRTGYMPDSHQIKSGTVEGGPYSSTPGMHGNSEWIGTLRSVLEARGKLVAVELGLGWAPWLVASALAAKKLGIADIRLIGVEASDEHVAYALQHLRDNGLDPGEHRILHAAVGATDGIARFPRITEPAEHYGASAAFSDDEETERHGVLREWEWTEVPCVSLHSLLAGIDVVDILHCDIQGAETAALTAAIDRLDQCLRRIVIGTHSRLIDGEIIQLFAGHGWVLEYELPCAIRQFENGEVLTLTDGEQVWRNPRIP